MASYIVFDKENKQIPYMHIARDWNNRRSVVGYVVVDTSDWTSTYWMYLNNKNMVHIKPETIRPFNQIEHIKYDLECGVEVILTKKPIYLVDEKSKEDNIIAIINNIDEIPYELWG